MSSAAVRKEDVVGISSLSFSNTGNGVYLSSSSELQQISLSARHTVAAGDERVMLVLNFVSSTMFIYLG